MSANQTYHSRKGNQMRRVDHQPVGINYESYSTTSTGEFAAENKSFFGDQGPEVSSVQTDVFEGASFSWKTLWDGVQNTFHDVQKSVSLGLLSTAQQASSLRREVLARPLLMWANANHFEPPTEG